MSAAFEAATCMSFDPWLTAYVDEELDAVHCLELEAHLDECAACSEQHALLIATRHSLQRVLTVQVPESLKARLSESLMIPEESFALGEEAAEDEQVASLDTSLKETAPQETAAPEKIRDRLWYMLPLAAAATFMLMFGASQLSPASETIAVPDTASVAPTAVASFDTLLQNLVRDHAHPPPPETTDPEGVRSFDPFIGVKVRAPSFSSDTQYVGARMHRDTALMQYVVRKRHRVTLYVFDSKKVPVRGLEERVARKSGFSGLRRYKSGGNVYVGEVRGFSVAASERNGVGYALASDLGVSESAELIAVATR